MSKEAAEMYRKAADQWGEVADRLEKLSDAALLGILIIVFGAGLLAGYLIWGIS